MKTLALGFAPLIGLALPLFVEPPVEAAPRRNGLRGALTGSLAGAPTVPPEWAGVWAFTDTTYDCQGNVLDVDAGADTLCTGQSLDQNLGSPLQLTCDGTVTATTVNSTCVANFELVPGCLLRIDMVIDGERQGDTYVISSVMTQDYIGDTPECQLLPDECTRRVSRGTRIAPEPADYCATPAAVTSWGRVKSQYR